MNKRIFGIFFFIIALSLVGCGENSKKGTEGLSYEQRNGSYYVSGYSGEDVNVVIPEKYNDVEITGIGPNAFSQSDIQTIECGKNIVFVGDNAFSNCTLLKSVKFNSKELTLYMGAFEDCINLKSVDNNAKDYTVNLMIFAFSNCEALESLDFSNASNGIIDTMSFTDCSNLKTLKLSKDITLKHSHGSENHPYISEVNGILILCDAEIEYK